LKKLSNHKLARVSSSKAAAKDTHLKKSIS
jgi:hypothetical protein